MVLASHVMTALDWKACCLKGQEGLYPASGLAKTGQRELQLGCRLSCAVKAFRDERLAGTGMQAVPLEFCTSSRAGAWEHCWKVMRPLVSGAGTCEQQISAGHVCMCAGAEVCSCCTASTEAPQVSRGSQSHMHGCASGRTQRVMQLQDGSTLLVTNKIITSPNGAAIDRASPSMCILSCSLKAQICSMYWQLQIRGLAAATLLCLLRRQQASYALPRDLPVLYKLISSSELTVAASTMPGSCWASNHWQRSPTKAAADLGLGQAQCLSKLA